MPSRELFDIGVNWQSLNYEKVKKDMEQATQYARELINSFKTPLDKKSTEELVTALQNLNKLQLERENALKNDKILTENIKALEQARILAKKQGNNELAEEYKKASAQFQLEREKNAESLKAEREITAEIEKQKSAINEKYKLDEENIQKTNKYRDDLRTKGFNLKVFNPMTALNNEFNDKIKTNDSIISKSMDRMKEIDEELLATDLTDAEREEKKAEKEALQNKIDIASSSNKKLSTTQTAMNTAMNTLKSFGKVANTVFKTMGIDLKSIMSDVIGNISQMLKETGIASYNTGSSLFTNASAREQQMKYGLSNSSNYALTQTMEMLNMKSDDDLLYMNQNQKEVFNNLMDRYRTWYENLESTGAMVKLQEAQLEFKMFKQELSMKLLNWFADHKDAIFKILELIMGALEVIANVVEWILDLIPGSSSASRNSVSSSDNYNSNTNSNININVNNTNNATANLNSKAELDNSLNYSNQNLVKQIATSLTSR